MSDNTYKYRMTKILRDKASRLFKTKYLTIN